MKLNIKKKRLKKKLSIRELEELSGVSRTTISRLENGIIPKSLLELEALANALEVNIKSFFRWIAHKAYYQVSYLRHTKLPIYKAFFRGYTCY